MIETGKVLQQRYRIEKQIGQGGMGAVYVATDERFGSTVAIKETLCMDDNYRKAIEREARLLNSLKHTALPRVTDHFLEENGQFLVMEYIPGDDLSEMMERNQRAFPAGNILNWADQLLDALDFLHTQSIPVVHRDIKPQNLKITPRGQIILLDFGLAKGNPTDAGHQTAAKSIFGYSRNYASLEQIQGTGTDPRSDLYSLAATLYHLLTGVPPEDALTRAMAVLSGSHDPLTPAHLMNAEIPPGVSAILHKALDLNADGRPSSAVEMRQMLRTQENYAQFAAAAPPAIPMPSEILTQNTKLMAEATQQLGERQTDVKTEVLPSYLSQVTSVSNRITSGDSDRQTEHLVPVPPVSSRGSRRRVAAAAVVCGGLLLAGTMAAGVYMYNPGILGTAAEVEKNAGQTSGEAANSATDPADLTPTTGGSGAATADGSVPSAPSNPIDADNDRTGIGDGSGTAKPSDTDKAARQPSGVKQAHPVDVDDPDIEIVSDDGNVFEKRGKITTRDTDDDEDDPQPQAPRKAPIPNLPRDFGDLPPEVRQKLLRSIRRRNSEIVTRPTPNRRP